MGRHSKRATHSETTCWLLQSTGKHSIQVLKWLRYVSNQKEYIYNTHVMAETRIYATTELMAITRMRIEKKTFLNIMDVSGMGVQSATVNKQ